MTEHFWMRKQELCGSLRKPPCDAKWVQEAARAAQTASQLEAAQRAAARRLGTAMLGWHSLKARILAKVAA